MYVSFCIHFVYGLISQIGLARGGPNCEKEFRNLLLLATDFDCLEVGLPCLADRLLKYVD